MKTAQLEELIGSIKGAFNKGTGGGMFRDILKLEKHKTYIVRLVPNVEDGVNSLFPFSYYGWTSESTGNYIEFLNPEVFGKPNPLKKLGYEEWRGVKDLPDDDERKIKAKKLWKRFACLVNAYVISDETNPENNGKVKMIRMGKQLYDIVENAFQGDEKDEFGVRIFDLSPNGCNLKIKVTENKGGYANYQTSKFVSPSEIDEIGDSDSKIEDVWSKIFDLATVFPIKSYDAIKELVALHYYNEEPEKTESVTEDVSEDDGEEEGDVRYEEKPKEKVKEKPKEKVKEKVKEKKPEPVEDNDEDFDLDDFLANVEIE